MNSCGLVHGCQAQARALIPVLQVNNVSELLWIKPEFFDSVGIFRKALEWHFFDSVGMIASEDQIVALRDRNPWCHVLRYFALSLSHGGKSQDEPKAPRHYQRHDRVPPEKKRERIELRTRPKESLAARRLSA